MERLNATTARSIVYSPDSILSAHFNALANATQLFCDPKPSLSPVVQVGADYDHFNIREQNHGIVPEADEALVHQDATGIHLGRELVGDVVKLVWTGYRGYDDFA